MVASLDNLVGRPKTNSFPRDAVDKEKHQPLARRSHLLNLNASHMFSSAQSPMDLDFAALSQADPFHFDWPHW